MSTGLRELLPEDLNAAVERSLTPRLAATLRQRQAGHCARVNDLPTELAARVCRRLRRTLPDVQAYVLRGAGQQVPDDVAVSSTKLVELRNPDDDGQARPPLVIFVPPGSRASAEDSFGVATFEDLTIGAVYDDLAAEHLAALPTPLREPAVELFTILDDLRWPQADALGRARWLLTVELNGCDPEAAGAAIFEVGLVPDFELFADPDQTRHRVTRNAQYVTTLTYSNRTPRGRVIALRLDDANFRKRLAEFVAHGDMDRPRAWTRRIVVDRTNWDLSFHRWPRGRTDTDAIDITVSEVGLPVAGDRPDDATDPVLQSLIGQRYLSLSGNVNQLTARFRVGSDPRGVPGLIRFSVELVSEDSGPTGAVASVRVSTTSRLEYKATVRRLKRAGLEEGWHFLRVLPVDGEGIPLPVGSDQAGGHPANESERFYVVTTSESAAPPQQRVTRDIGVAYALVRQRFDAVSNAAAWSEVDLETMSWKDAAGSRHPALRAVIAGQVIEIPLSGVLVDVQRRILAQADAPARWRLTCGLDGTEAHLDRSVIIADDMTPFSEARRRLFDRLVDHDLVIEGIDVRALRDEIRAYAETYTDLVARQLQRVEREGDGFGELAGLLSLDTVDVELPAGNGASERATLIAPAHPLRLLWLLGWAELGQRWLHDVPSGDKAAVSAAHDALRELSPLGFPLVVPRTDGRLTAATHNLTPYWGVCVPTDTNDPRSLVDRLAGRLELPSRPPDAAEVTGRSLADRVERYLRLHPYVRVLTIAAINPGRGDQLADMLVALQRRSALREICYDVRLFVDEPDAAPETGAALAELLRGERNAADGEPFANPTVNGLVPKLAVSIRPLSEFSSASSSHAVHLTMLFDAFGAEQFDAAPADGRTTVPVHGLVQDMTVDYEEDDETVVWHRTPRHGAAAALLDAEEVTDLLGTLPAVCSRAAAAVATGQAGTHHVPRVSLALDVADKTLLHQAHRSSDWVFCIDRNLGVEYFDSPAQARRPAYVIDEAPRAAGGLGHHVVISSRSIEELQALLEPAVEQHGLNVEARHVATFFDQLRLLSGRLAFKIASAAATQRTEVLGLALARLYLDYQGALTDQVLVPLDAHLELYREARRRADEVDAGVGLRRTDLALFDLNHQDRLITCRLVEVKCSSSLRELSAYQTLKNEIAEQLAASTKVIRESFDPAYRTPDRVDRVVKNHEFATLLRNYLRRSARHGVMRADAADEAGAFINELDRGYRLRFTRTGLIFDLAGSGLSTETEGDVEFHRIGADSITELLDAIPTDPAMAMTREQIDLSSADLTVPRSAEAAYRSPSRPHHPAADDYTHEGTLETEPSRVADVTEPATGSAVPSPGEPTDDTDHPTDGDSAAATTGHSGPVGEEEPGTGPKPADGPTVSVPEIQPDIFIGTNRPSPQYGLLGEAMGKRVALDLNETHTISLFGVQGGGKSYTLGTIIEMACLAAPPVNELPHPLATIVFHYSQTRDYAPEFTSMVAANSDAEQIQRLRDTYGVAPQAMDDVALLVPHGQLDVRQSEYPGLDVRPLTFGSAELRAENWRFLMGAVGNQSTYIRQLQRIMRAHRNDLRLDVIRHAVDDSNLSDALKQLAQQRLDLASDYIDDSSRITDLVRPGRMIIVDLRDEFIEKDEALGLFVVLMQLFAEVRHDGHPFNKLVVFDEAHKYMGSADLIDGLVASVREMRHKGMSVLVASQDPPSVPISLIELSSQILLHKFTSPAWLKHLQKANAALADLTPAKMAGLTPGEAYLWASRSTDAAFTRGAIKIRCRPRLTQHGGHTKTAVQPDP